MTELTTSRIHRLFRSLRSKCTALAALTAPPAKPVVSITYGSAPLRRPLEQDETPPLAILQSLDKYGARLHLDRAIVENMQLSKRIYEVRDAFKNIVQSTFGSAEREDSKPYRILSLAGVCARLVGEHVQSEIQASIDIGSDADDDDLRTQVMDVLYDEVPSSYRKYTLAAHALTYILETCPHHPTLLHALLEVCAAHRLVPEAHTVLRELFTVAILPRPNSSLACPLTHPAHKNFLTSIRETCATPGNRDSALPQPTYTLINDQTFTRILVNALSQPCPEQLHAWTSKAVTRLARDLRQRDFAGCFLPLVLGLAFDLTQHNVSTRKEIGQNVKRLDQASAKLHQDALERLAKWLVSMLDTLHARVSSAPGTEEHQACVDFLGTIEPLQHHVSSAPPASHEACIADALCCLAAYCLASPLSLPGPTTDRNLSAIESLLRAARVRNQTFDGLISHIFPLPSLNVFRMPLSECGGDTPTPPPTNPAITDGGIGAVHALAAPLRSRGLLQCEVALYRGALEHVEALIAAPAHALPPSLHLTQKELFDIRLELIDHAEDAERRCYGAASDPSRAGNGDQEWVWEEMVGSWVVKSPAPVQAKRMRDTDLVRASKRRRLEDPDRRKTDNVCSSSLIGRPASISVRSTFPRASTISSKGGRGSSSCSTRTLQDTATKETVFAGAPSRAPSYPEDDPDSDIDPLVTGDINATPVPVRTRNFATILADAQRNVISLRAEREAAAAAANSRAQHAPKPKPRASAPARIFHVPDSPASASVLHRRRPEFAVPMVGSQKNVISLRAERERERARGGVPRSSVGHGRVEKTRQSQLSTKTSLDTETEDEEFEDRLGSASTEPESSPVKGAFMEPSSDDALNLFAYPDSSPVNSRRRVR